MNLEKDIDGSVVLAVSNSYEKLYFMNDDFSGLPEIIKKDIQVLLVMHTEEVGGIIVIGFTAEGKMYIEAMANEYDGYYDEIGSHLKIKQYRIDHRDLFEQLEEYYECFF